MAEDEVPESKSLAHVQKELDGVIVQHRADQAYAMRMSGKSPSEIAKELGYEDGQQVGRAIMERFKQEATQITSLERESILQLELDRLDMMQQGLWAEACYGDPKSVDMVLKIMALRVKLTGIDQPDTQTGQHTVLVVGGDEQSYVEKLKGLTNGD